MLRLPFFLFCLWSLSLCPSGIFAAEKDRPNVVFILADDLGYRELGSFGQQLIRTPNLDELARQGMRLTQHYSGNAVCAPSRHALHFALRDRPHDRHKMLSEVIDLTLCAHMTLVADVIDTE